MSPPSNRLISANDDQPEPFFPLRVYFCERCHLVQLPQFQTAADIFSEYPYFSSYSKAWLAHVDAYARMAVKRFSLSPGSLVVELASNDGSLLKCFAEASIPVLGIEPARNVARAASSAGIPTLTEFFGKSLAAQLAADGKRADLIVANNVLAHAPDLRDFVAGVQELLKPQGVATFEFPHLLRLIEHVEFDTIYHEHFSYFSLECVLAIFAAHGLTIFDVQEVPTHGGSLRVYAARTASGRVPSDACSMVLSAERAAGLDRYAGYADFGQRVQSAKQSFRAFLQDSAAQGKRVAGYGAPAKATTLLNYCGVKSDLVSYTVDKNPHKQSKMIPGVRIPIFAPEKIFETKPDYVVIFPWNIKDEIAQQMAGIAQWGGRFVVPIPVATLYLAS